MAPHIRSSGSDAHEKIVSRYMQEIRDIAKAGLNRRELLRMGLVMGGAGAAAEEDARKALPRPRAPRARPVPATGYRLKVRGAVARGKLDPVNDRR